MKQYRRVPFDIELAKKIQSGEVKGRIVRKGTQKQVCEILEFYAEWQTHCDEKFLIVKIPAHDFERERLWIYHQDGRAHHNTYPEMWYDLVLEIPDNEPQFKPFDKVLVRDEEEEIWQPRLYEMCYEKNGKHYCQDGHGWNEAIPYEGNEHLVGTTDNC